MVYLKSPCHRLLRWGLIVCSMQKARQTDHKNGWGKWGGYEAASKSYSVDNGNRSGDFGPFSGILTQNFTDFWSHFQGFTLEFPYNLGSGPNQSEMVSAPSKQGG